MTEAQVNKRADVLSANQRGMPAHSARVTCSPARNLAQCEKFPRSRRTRIRVAGQLGPHGARLHTEGWYKVCSEAYESFPSSGTHALPNTRPDGLQSTIRCSPVARAAAGKTFDASLHLLHVIGTHSTPPQATADSRDRVAAALRDLRNRLTADDRSPDVAVLAVEAPDPAAQIVRTARSMDAS